jgi:LCCL domain
MAPMITRTRHALLPTLVVLVLATACSASQSATATPAPVPAEGGDGADNVAEAWAASANTYRENIGEHYDYDCPAGGTPHTVWGTDIYTDDSSVCTAAVHLGEITLEDGGSVTIEMAEGLDSYEGTERNGIETLSYPSWPGSFVFVLETD